MDYISIGVGGFRLVGITKDAQSDNFQDVVFGSPFLGVQLILVLARIIDRDNCFHPLFLVGLT